MSTLSRRGFLQRIALVAGALGVARTASAAEPAPQPEPEPEPERESCARVLSDGRRCHNEPRRDGWCNLHAPLVEAPSVTPDPVPDDERLHALAPYGVVRSVKLPNGEVVTFGELQDRFRVQDAVHAEASPRT